MGLIESHPENPHHRFVASSRPDISRKDSVEATRPALELTADCYVLDCKISNSSAYWNVTVLEICAAKLSETLYRCGNPFCTRSFRVQKRRRRDWRLEKSEKIKSNTAQIVDSFFAWCRTRLLFAQRSAFRSVRRGNRPADKQTIAALDDTVCKPISLAIDSLVIFSAHDILLYAHICKARVLLQSVALIAQVQLESPVSQFCAPAYSTIFPDDGKPSRSISYCWAISV